MSRFDITLVGRWITVVQNARLLSKSGNPGITVVPLTATKNCQDLFTFRVVKTDA